MTPHRYSYLDGLRGIAAFFVLVRHTEPFWNFTFPRSYLAVDIFFILSGFVISMAYDEKLRKKSLQPLEFLKVRVIRLYPVLFLSLIVSISIFIYQWQSGRPSLTPQTFSLVALFALFLIPIKVSGYASLFVINGPFWSLFYEIIANAIYAFIRPLLRGRLLLLSIAGFGVIVCAGAFAHHDLDVGFNWGVVSMGAGFSRAMLGIFIGLLLHRKFAFFEKHIKKLPPTFSIIVMCAIFCSPTFGKWSPLVDIAAIFVLFPLCVYWGAVPDGDKKYPVLQALGSASYPLYVLHVPLGYVFAVAFQPVFAKYAPFSGIAFALMLIALSIAVEKVYDIPVRRWLSSRLLARRKNYAATPEAT
ncbi:acyltransferase family protein [Pseudoduganella sp. FT55W]|uniref:Acyltransferase family protein n=1 Tax=Duganella rivi TaxID=2666083 RepID=A0A7X4GLM7_9BURK|nr:acyltransferase [Duganella rivi]MYM65281.1 acyltransferase family protein [Duganella rivi]